MQPFRGSAHDDHVVRVEKDMEDQWQGNLNARHVVILEGFFDVTGVKGKKQRAQNAALSQTFGDVDRVGESILKTNLGCGFFVYFPEESYEFGRNPNTMEFFPKLVMGTGWECPSEVKKQAYTFFLDRVPSVMAVLRMKIWSSHPRCFRKPPCDSGRMLHLVAQSASRVCRTCVKSFRIHDRTAMGG